MQKWIDRDPWLTSLVLVSQSVCELILVICDTMERKLAAGHQYENVPEMSGIIATDGMCLFTAQKDGWWD